MTTLGSQYRGSKEYLMVYSALIQAAQAGRRLHYKDVAGLIGVPLAGHHMARQVGQVLGEISTDEHAAGRPMLSAIAVNEAGYPGEGFFKLARTLGKLLDTQQEESFLEMEQQTIYREWAKP